MSRLVAILGALAVGLAIFFTLFIFYGVST